MHYFLFIFIPSILFSSTDVHPYLESNKLRNNSNSVSVLAFMVQFQQEISPDPRTTGDGQFLLEEPEEYMMYHNSDISKCDGFKIDHPPHNRLYFEDQLKAVKNYYKSISNDKIDFSYSVIDSIFSLDAVSALPYLMRKFLPCPLLTLTTSPI